MKFKQPLKRFSERLMKDNKMDLCFIETSTLLNIKAGALFNFWAYLCSR
jgi:hypothetical protein